MNDSIFFQTTPQSSTLIEVEIATDDIETISRPQQKLPLGMMGLGLLAGIVGIASMSLNQRSRRFGKMPSDKASRVSVPKLEKVLRKPEKMGSSGWLLKQAMHWGQGALAAIAKPAISKSRASSDYPSFLLTGLRLSTDQILENLFRVGLAKNFTKQERRLDLFQRAAFAFATGFFADLLSKPGLSEATRQKSS